MKCNPNLCTYGNFDFAWTLAENDCLRAERDALRAVLKRIDAINDNPAWFNPEIDAAIADLEIKRCLTEGTTK